MIQESETNSHVTRFGPGTTVVHGYPGSSLRFASSLVDAVCGDPDGVHVELHLGGRELAVFRPDDGAHRVIDVDGAIDVSDEFRHVAGVLDLLAPLGVSRLRAESAMLLSATDHGDDVAPEQRRSRLRPVALAGAVVAAGLGALVVAEPVQMAACLAAAVVCLVAWAVTGRRSSVRVPRTDADTIETAVAAAREATGIDDPLPVIIVDVFATLAPDAKAAALDAAIRASEHGQVIVVTDDPEVVDLARFRHMAGELAVTTPDVVESETSTA